MNGKQAFETNAVDFDPFEGPEIELIAPATESQTEIWASCIIGDDDANCAFNECFSLELTGALNSDAMQKALQDVVNMHQSLRMTFSADGSSICIFKSATLNYDYQDISAKSQTGATKIDRRF